MSSYVFLFTDVEGSTRLWEREAERMRAAMADHDALLRDAVVRHGGRVVKMSGDGIHAVFDAVPPALKAITDIQLALREPLGGLHLKVRSALHVGPAEERDGDYFGTTVNRAARLAAAAHGGQVLISEPVREAINGELAALAPLSLRTLGVVRLRDLSAAEPVHQLVHPELPDDFPQLRAMASHPNNLPHALNAFVGRRRELDAIDAHFQRARLVTLAGPGGIGKSRLALQAAARLIDRFPDGVWLVELAPLADADALIAAVAGVMGVKEARGQALVDTLCRRLAERQTLLIIDNCEHLIDACAHLVDRLLRAAPRLNILATSRETLDIDGEAVLNVPSLPVPDPEFPSGLAALLDVDAARLFVERARLHHAEFTVSEAETATLARVLYRLDGIPLAVELAAARLKTLSLAELDRGLDDRFGLLTTGSRVAPPRHKTLRALVDWSHDLLTPTEQRVFARLAVFAGGWSIDSATLVVSDAVVPSTDMYALLVSLEDKSLIQPVPGDGPPRWRMLETLRQYAQDRLDASGETGSCRDRLVHWVARLCCDLGVRDPALRAPDWDRVLDRERDNWRAALDHAADRDDLADAALEACRALGDYWYARAHYGEGTRNLERWCTWILANPAQAAVMGDTARQERAARLFYARARCDYMQARLDPAEVACLEAEARFRAVGRMTDVSRAMMLRSYCQFIRAGHWAAKAVCDEALGIMVDHDLEPWALAHAFSNAANNALFAGDLSGAAAYRDWASRTLAGKLDLLSRASWRYHLGVAAMAEGDFQGAIEQFQAGVRLADDKGSIIDLATLQNQLALALWGLGDTAAALAHAQTSIRLLKPSSPSMEFINALEAFAAILAESGAAEPACKIVAAAERMREDTGFPVGAQAQAVLTRVEAALAALQSQSGLQADAAQQGAWRAAGRLLSGPQAADLALEIHRLASPSLK